MSVVEIQFDQQTFPDSARCHQWLREQPDYVYLTTLKGFRLRASRSERMSSEPRKIFGWTGDEWRYTQTRKVRPEAGILIVLRDGGDVFSESEVPPLSPKTQQKRREQELKNATKERNAAQRKMDNKIKRQIEKAKKQMKKVKEENKQEKSKKRKSTTVKDHIVLKEKSRKKKKEETVKLEVDDDESDNALLSKASASAALPKDNPILKTVEVSSASPSSTPSTVFDGA